LRDAGHLRYVPILMEIDDNILSVPAYNPAFAAYSPGNSIRGCAEKQLKISDGIIVSTPYLQEIYNEYNKNVYCIQNSIDWSLWGKLKNKPKSGVRIGWAGGSAHTEDLEIIEKVIPKILNANSTAKFVFVHGIAEFLVELESKYRGRIELVKQWTPIDKYPSKIASLDFDIALAPLVDSAFNRGKSNLRWLEAAALSIPCVASNVGHFADTIENGVDGILCDDEMGFETAINALIKDKSLRRGMGARANIKAKEKFDVDWVAQKYIDSLKDCSNKVAEKEFSLKAGQENVNDQREVADACIPDGRGCPTDAICKPV